MSDSYGSHIRARRRQLGLTQLELSELSGASVRFLHDLEHDKPSVRLDVLLSVLDALGLELQLVLRPSGGGGRSA